MAGRSHIVDPVPETSHSKSQWVSNGMATALGKTATHESMAGISFADTLPVRPVRWRLPSSRMRHILVRLLHYLRLGRRHPRPVSQANIVLPMIR